MKKNIIKKLKICILLFFLLFSNVQYNNAISKAVAISDLEPEYSNYMQYYFYNLKNNYAMNLYGSCGYVAVGMLLSYYDTFHDDRIIPDYFDETGSINGGNIENNQSPGIKTEKQANYGQNNPFLNLNSEQFVDQVISGSNQGFFQSYLFRLGIENGFYPNPHDAQKFASIAELDMITLIIKYLSHDTNIVIDGEGMNGKNFIQFIPNVDFNVENCSIYEDNKDSEDVIQFAKEKILEGKPVLLTIDNYSFHVYLAYDYKDNNGNDVFYCHYGGDSSKTYENPIGVGDEPVFTSAISLEFNTPHSCSNNYVVKDYDTNGNVISEKTYCYEHKDIITYNHVCSYGEWVATDSKHTKTCHCTEKIEGAHTYDSNNTCTVCAHHTHDYHYSYVSRTQCKGVCEYCNYQIITTHNINLLTKVCRQCFARFFNDGVEVPINNLPPDIVCTKNHQHNSSCVIVARE